MLANTRHEAFAHALARGVAVHLAYVEAGFKANSGNATRLGQNPKVIERVAALRGLVENVRKRSTVGAVLTREWVIEKLMGNVIMAEAQEKPDLAGSNKALHLLGLELGMFVERKETGKPGEFDGLTIAGKRDRALSIARQLGLVGIEQPMVEVEVIAPEDDAT